MITPKIIDKKFSIEEEKKNVKQMLQNMMSLINEKSHFFKNPTSLIEKLIEIDVADNHNTAIAALEDVAQLVIKEDIPPTVENDANLLSATYPLALLGMLSRTMDAGLLLDAIEVADKNKDKSINAPQSMFVGTEETIQINLQTNSGVLYTAFRDPDFKTEYKSLSTPMSFKESSSTISLVAPGVTHCHCIMIYNVTKNELWMMHVPPSSYYSKLPYVDLLNGSFETKDGENVKSDEFHVVVVQKKYGLIGKEFVASLKYARESSMEKIYIPYEGYNDYFVVFEPNQNRIVIASHQQESPIRVYTGIFPELNIAKKSLYAHINSLKSVIKNAERAYEEECKSRRVVEVSSLYDLKPGDIPSSKLFETEDSKELSCQIVERFKQTKVLSINSTSPKNPLKNCDLLIPIPLKSISTLVNTKELSAEDITPLPGYSGLAEDALSLSGYTDKYEPIIYPFEKTSDLENNNAFKKIQPMVGIVSIPKLKDYTTNNWNTIKISSNKLIFVKLKNDTKQRALWLPISCKGLENDYPEVDQYKKYFKSFDESPTPDDLKYINDFECLLFGGITASDIEELWVPKSIAEDQFEALKTLDLPIYSYKPIVNTPFGTIPTFFDKIGNAENIRKDKLLFSPDNSPDCNLM